MKNYFILLGLLIHQTFSLAQDNIVSRGIADSVYSREYTQVSKYRSQINFPPFIDWSLDGKKMLFDGGKVIYSMKTYKSEIKE